MFIIIGLILAPVGNGFGDQGNNEVIIDDSGSTNFSGYRATIEPSGQVDILAHGRVSNNSVYSYGKYKVAPEDVKKLIDDLEAVMPLSKLSADFCVRSVSFGTKTYVTYKDQTSPDIQCLKSKEFVKDIYRIMATIPRGQNGVKLP